mmetsp:Transcript_29552/g.55286  ORF Transcript_29552/g.55286 Transcript_29552/m.55286 type:complete len:200 (+) Transcript_29552:582-1181(+)
MRFWIADWASTSSSVTSVPTAGPEETDIDCRDAVSLRSDTKPAVFIIAPWRSFLNSLLVDFSCSSKFVRLRILAMHASQFMSSSLTAIKDFASCSRNGSKGTSSTLSNVLNSSESSSKHLNFVHDAAKAAMALVHPSSNSFIAPTICLYFRKIGRTSLELLRPSAFVFKSSSGTEWTFSFQLRMSLDLSFAFCESISVA